MLQSIVDPWYKSLENPQQSQEQTLLGLIKDYAKTQYGKNHNVSSIKNIADFQTNFPVTNCKALSTYFAQVNAGDHAAILPEPLLCWVMTRGSTGPAKVLPITQTHVEQILTCGARALVNHALRKNDLGLFAGKILNLNFPSSVHTITVNGREVSYGYSSGTYARLNPALNEISLVPRQEDVDTLGPGITNEDWRNRFELAYQKGLNENVVAVMGVTPVILAFARYVNEEHGKRPKDLWKFKALLCTSVRKIPFRYAPKLGKYYGEAPVVEMYSATEGVFAQQLDDLPYVTPNYDTYLFEVETGRGIKLLHELKRGEWGRLLISSCLFPRYNMGDIIEAAGKNYFRVVGRDRFSVLLEHRLYRLFFGRLV